MNKIMIITSYIEGTTEEIKKLIVENNYDFLICADGGYDIASLVDVKVDMVVGDFDSSKSQPPSWVKTITVPTQKDYTDLQLALSIACEKNPTDILIIGGIGGRVDHTLGNIQTMVHYAKKGFNIEMIDPYQSICIHEPGTKTYRGNKHTKFSTFAYSESVTGLTYQGAYYPLTDYTLTDNFPLGISNQFLEDEIQVTTESGTLIIVRTIL